MKFIDSHHNRSPDLKPRPKDPGLGGMIFTHQFFALLGWFVNPRMSLYTFNLLDGKAKKEI